MNTLLKTLAVLAVLAATSTSAAEPKPAILFCSPQGVSWGWLDLRYAQELHAKGFEIDYTEHLAEITPERIKNYNVLVIYSTPDAFDVTNRGMKSSPEKAKTFAAMIDRYVASGGGVLLMPTECNMLKQQVSDLTDLWGAKIPVEMPAIGVEAPAGLQTVVAVQNFSGLQTAVRRAGNLEELPASEQRRLLPAAVLGSLLYVGQTFGRDWSLDLEMTAAKPPQRIQAVVDLLALTTTIDPSGACRMEMRASLQNRSEQFLRVQVPPGLSLWSAEVAGEPVRPARDPARAGEVLIPLVKTSPGGLPYDVKAYFAGESNSPLGRLARIRPPAVRIVGMEVARTVWTLRLPKGYRYFRPGGNMSPLTGEVEKSGIELEAKLEQWERLGRSLEEVSSYNYKAKETAARNWELQRKQVEADVQRLQRQVAENRDDVRGELYGGQQAKIELLNKKIEQSRADQNRRLGQFSNTVSAGTLILSGQNNAWQEEAELAGTNRYSNGAYVTANNPFAAANQPAGLEDNTLAYNLNSTIVNAGTPEFVRSGQLTTLPQFFKTQAQAEQAAVSEQLGQLTRAGGDQSAKGPKDAPLTVDGFVDDAYVLVPPGEALRLGGDADERKKLASRTVLGLEAQQREKAVQQLAKQQATNLDNRVQRYFEDASRQSPQVRGGLADTDGAKARRFGYSVSGIAASQPAPQGEVAPLSAWSNRSPDREDDGRLGRSGEAPAQAAGLAAAPAGPGEKADTGLSPGLAPYSGAGTFSLPVALPEGQVQLDYSCTGGQPELTLWVAGESMVESAYGTADVIGAAIVALIAWRILVAAAKRVRGRSFKSAAAA